MPVIFGPLQEILFEVEALAERGVVEVEERGGVGVGWVICGG